MSKIASKQDWADDFADDADGLPHYKPQLLTVANLPLESSTLPPQTVTTNKDGTKTVTSYRFNEDGKRCKITRRIRTTIVKETVNPRVAERRAWAKFGLEKGHPAGPSFDTTSVGENIIFRPSVTWKKDGKEDAAKGKDDPKEKLKNMKVKCRICDGEHFTARCPYKDTMAPVGETEGGTGDNGEEESQAVKEGGLGQQSGGYVPPHLRKGAKESGGERMGGRYERDDLATLRVTNVSEFAEENDLREIFERFGRVTRVFLAKDRETGRAKGFAFISFQERTDAAKACEKIDGCKCSPWRQILMMRADSCDRWLRAFDSSCGIRKACYVESFMNDSLRINSRIITRNTFRNLLLYESTFASA